MNGKGNFFKRLLKVESKRIIAVLLLASVVLMTIPAASFPSVSVNGAQVTASASDAEKEIAVVSESDVSESDAVIADETVLSDSDVIVSESDAEASDDTVSASDAQASDDTVSASDAVVSDSDIPTIAETHPAFSSAVTVGDIRVRVSAPEGVFPAGAQLSVTAANESVSGNVEQLIGVDGSSDCYTFDIKVLLDGEEIQPDTAYGSAVVRFTMDTVPNNAEVSVYHIDDELTDVETMRPVVFYDSVTVQTSSFSMFTIEFVYGEYEYSIDGNSTVMLSAVLAELGITGTVTEASSSDETLFTVTSNGADWEIKNVKLFLSTETLTVVADGITYTIAVKNNIGGTNGECVWELDSTGKLTVRPANGVSGWLDSRTSLGYGLLFLSDMLDYDGHLLVTSIVIEDGVKTDSLLYFFRDFENVVTIDASGLDVSAATNYNSAFLGLSKLESVDISTWDTSNGEKFGSMFYGCSKLESIDATIFDAAKPTQIGGFFRGCRSLKEIDVSGWDVSNVTSLAWTFYECTNVTELDVSGWDVSNVENFQYTFGSCVSLEYLDVSNWDTSAATKMYWMYYSTPALLHFEVSPKWQSADDYEGLYDVTEENGKLTFHYQYNEVGLTAKSVTIYNNGEVINVDLDTYKDSYTLDSYTDDTVADLVFQYRYKVNFFNSKVSTDPLSTQLVFKNEDAADPYADTADIPVFTGVHYVGWDKSFTNVQASIDVNAVYETNGYTVKFDANGGEGTMADQTFLFDQSKALSQNKYTRTGYKFLGWSLDADAKEKTYSDKATVKNLTDKDGEVITLYAVWDPITYKISFYSNGGRGTMNSQTMTYDVETPISANAFTRSGYHFLGWSTTSSGEVEYTDQQVVKNLKEVSGTTVYLYAVWEANNYTVRFNANGGEGTMADQDFVYGVREALNPNKFTRVGYTFYGWNTAPDDTYAWYADEEEIAALTSKNGVVVDLYAIWGVNTYTVKFDANGGEGTMEDQLFGYDYEQALSANKFSREGHEFLGWSTDSAATAKTYSDKQVVKNLTAAADGEVTLYAVWSAYSYTVEFEANGGEGTMADQIFAYDEEKALSANEFSREGYEFLGWNTVSAATVKTYSDKEIVKNLTDKDGGVVTLYAVWSANSYTVEFDANGGEGTMADQAFVYDVEQALSANEFSREGYEFLGWSTDSAATAKTYSDKDVVKNLTDKDGGVVTLYAVWSANSYTVKFDANGGEGTMSDQIFAYDEEKALSANEFTLEDYVFAGWNTDKDAETALYGDEELVKNLCSSDGDSITLYAVWEKNVLTVTAEAGVGGSVTPTETKVTKGDDAVITITVNNRYVVSEITVNDAPYDISKLTASGDNKILKLENVEVDTAVKVSFKGSPVTGTPSIKMDDEFFVDETITFEAIGFWQSGTGFIAGDEYYVPSNWHHAEPSGNWGDKNDPTFAYTGSFTQSTAGDYTLKVEFQKYVHNGTDWEKSELVTVTHDYTVKNRAPSAGDSSVPQTGDYMSNGTVAVLLSLMVISAVYIVFCIVKRRSSAKAR